MECEFEEKQYEQLMNYELAEKGQIYPAGQCLEKDLGIDAALFFSPSSFFWRRWNNLDTFVKKHGVKLSAALWDVAEDKLRSGKFPKFKCNLFIQYKRPERISSPNGKEYKRWKQPYFRYSIKEHQQDALSMLERRTAPHALVVYACASFSKIEDLWQHAERNALVQNSNFCQPHDLIGHYRYTFVQNMKNGHACSEPAEVEGIDLLHEMGKLLEKPAPFEDNVQFLVQLAKNIEVSIGDLRHETGIWFNLIKDAMTYPEHRLARSIATILAFNFSVNTSWEIGYENKLSSP